MSVTAGNSVKVLHEAWDGATMLVLDKLRILQYRFSSVEFSFMFVNPDFHQPFHQPL